MIKHCILPDMADRDAYRRLKVWARAGVGKKKRRQKQNLRQIWIKRLFQTAFEAIKTMKTLQDWLSHLRLPIVPA